MKFDNPTIGRSFRNPINHQYGKAILIRPLLWQVQCPLVHTQLPLTPCWATTVHKVQGISLSHAVIDIGLTPGMSYVALSRVTSIHGLALSDFDEHRLTVSQAALTEMNRLLTQASPTP